MSAIKRLWRMAAVCALAALILAIYVLSRTSGLTGGEEVKPIPDKALYYVGILQESDVPEQDKMISGLKDALASRGYTEGKNLKITVRNADCDPQKMNENARKMASGRADLIIALGTDSAKAAARATKTIPVVGLDVLHFKTDDAFSFHSNMTGITSTPEALRQLRIAGRIIPLHSIGVLYNPDNETTRPQISTLRRISKNKEIALYEVAFKDEKQLISQLDRFKGKVDAVYIPEDKMVLNHFDQVVDVLTTRDHIPIIGQEEEMVRRGALLSVFPEYYRMGFSGGRMAADLLDGKEVPSDISIAIQIDPDIFINMKTCKKLNIRLPSDVWQIARKMYLYQGQPPRP